MQHYWKRSGVKEVRREVVLADLLSGTFCAVWVPLGTWYYFTNEEEKPTQPLQARVYLWPAAPRSGAPGEGNEPTMVQYYDNICFDF